MKNKVTKTESITFGYNISSADLYDFLAPIPRHAKIHIDHYKGDQRDPETTTVTASWDVVY